MTFDLTLIRLADFLVARQSVLPSKFPATLFDAPNVSCVALQISGCQREVSGRQTMCLVCDGAKLRYAGPPHETALRCSSH